MLRVMRRDGRLLRTYKGGEAKLNGYLEDYAFLIDGLVQLYEAVDKKDDAAKCRKELDAIKAAQKEPEKQP